MKTLPKKVLPRIQKGDVLEMWETVNYLVHEVGENLKVSKLGEPERAARVLRHGKKPSNFIHLGKVSE